MKTQNKVTIKYLTPLTRGAEGWEKATLNFNNAQGSQDKQVHQSQQQSRHCVDGHARTASLNQPMLPYVLQLTLY